MNEKETNFSFTINTDSKDELNRYLNCDNAFCALGGIRDFLRRIDKYGLTPDEDKLEKDKLLDYLSDEIDGIINRNLYP